MPHHSSSRNIFVHLRTCEEVCERTTGRLLESQNQGIAGVIQAVFNRNWDGAKRVRDQLLMTTAEPATTLSPSTTEQTVNLFEDVITPLPLLPETPFPVTVEVKPESIENSILIDQNVIGEEARNDILVIKTLTETVNENVNYSLAVNHPVTIAGKFGLFRMGFFECYVLFFQRNVWRLLMKTLFGRATKYPTGKPDIISIAL